MKGRHRKNRLCWMAFIVVLLAIIIVAVILLPTLPDLPDCKEIATEYTPEINEWSMVLVNPWNKLPDDFSVMLTELDNGNAVDSRIYNDLQEMLNDARSEGLEPLICSSYRSYELQDRLFRNKVDFYLSEGYDSYNAEREAAKWVAFPGTSEHQTGLAVDIVSIHYQLLDENQEDTPEQKWLMENSYKYGFILRYPTDKSHITGINYEPWHYRYVGKEVAKEIYEQGLCLEEYLEAVS